MIKTEFVDFMAEHYDFSRQDAEKVVTAFLDAIEDALCRDGKMIFRNFGSFEVAERKAHEGRNPATGEIIKVDASKTVVFRPSQELKQKVDGKN